MYFPFSKEREFFIDNLLVRNHLIIEMILVDRPCAMRGSGTMNPSCFVLARQRKPIKTHPFDLRAGDTVAVQGSPDG